MKKGVKESLDFLTEEPRTFLKEEMQLDGDLKELRILKG